MVLVFEGVYSSPMFVFIMISLFLAASIDADDPADDEVSEWEGEREKGRRVSHHFVICTSTCNSDQEFKLYKLVLDHLN